MPLLSVRNLVRGGVGLLGSMILATALLGSASAATLDPEVVQVQYLPQDGAAIVLWNAVDNATGYNIYEQTVTTPGSPSTMTSASAPVKVGSVADGKTTTFLVDKLTNGTPYHFTITAIVGGAETDPVGPRPAVNNGDDLGDFVAVVPQTPVTLDKIDGFYGYTIGTDLPGSHKVTTDATSGAQTISMTASGWDIQNSADGLYLLAVPMKGDLTVTARVVSGPTATANESTWNLGGVTVRGSLDAGSVLAMTQVAQNGTSQFKYRDTYDSSPPEEDDTSGNDPSRRPLWVKLVRKGNDFTGSLSDDGKTWTTLDSSGTGGTHTIDDMPATAYVGLALSAHDDGQYSTAVFDNFTITSP
jgi:hypothetical protein